MDDEERPYPPEFDPALNPNVSYPPEFDPALHPELKVAKNGVVYRRGGGKNCIVYGKNITTKITKENGAAYHKRRYDQYHEAFANGVIKSFKNSGLIKGLVDAPSEAIEIIGDKSATMLLDTNSARGYAEILNAVMENSGWKAPKGEGEGAAENFLDQLPEGVVMMIAKLADRPEMIAAQFEEVDNGE